jgi:hypothetical protein
VVGIARNVHLRMDSEQVEVLSFRLDRYGPDGSRAAPVGAEVWGYRGGQVGDGEEVEVTGRWSSGTLQAKRVVNRTTGAEIRGMNRTVRNVVLGVAFALVVGFILWVAASIVFM